MPAKKSRSARYGKDNVGLPQTLQEAIVFFADEDNAFDFAVSLRWPDGVFCPFCNSADHSFISTRKIWKCKDCKKQFSVRVGTIFEDSHISLDKWLIAIYLMCSSKKGISAHQIHRMLSLSYKAAWFMCHRIRYAMTQPAMIAKMTGTVEIDETYIGGKSRSGKGSGFRRDEKEAVVTLVQRGGRVRSFHMARVTAENLREVLKDNIEANANLMTDEAGVYKMIGTEFASHKTVNHSEKEYARGDVTTNRVEGFFGLLKRGINGTFHHVGPNHLHRYLVEFDFRFNARKTDDGTRTNMAIVGFEGKRLKYKD